MTPNQKIYYANGRYHDKEISLSIDEVIYLAQTEYFQCLAGKYDAADNTLNKLIPENRPLSPFQRIVQAATKQEGITLTIGDVNRIICTDGFNEIVYRDDEADKAARLASHIAQIGGNVAIYLNWDPMENLSWQDIARVKIAYEEQGHVLGVIEGKLMMPYAYGINGINMNKQEQADHEKMHEELCPIQELQKVVVHRLRCIIRGINGKGGRDYCHPQWREPIRPRQQSRGWDI